MIQDNRGCRKVLVEGGLGCFVILLSLGALIGFGLRAPRWDTAPEDPTPATEVDESPLEPVDELLKNLPEED